MIMRSSGIRWAFLPESGQRAESRPRDLLR